MDKARFPAICVAHTPSGPTNCCQDHAIKVVALFNFMGSHVHLEPILGEDVECNNCLNESKKSEN